MKLANQLSITFAGILNLAVRDWNEYPPPSNYYDDNSGVYIDIFVIDPEQEAGFNRFKDALFKANSKRFKMQELIWLTDSNTCWATVGQL